MIVFWIVLGCLFMIGIGVRFTFGVLGLTPAEAAALLILIVILVGINSAPVHQFIMRLL